MGKTKRYKSTTDKEYLIKIVVKNNILMSKMKAAGCKTAADLSRKSGVCQTTVGMYMNLKKTPYNRDGIFLTSVLKISRALKILPEDLFPERFLYKVLGKNKWFIEASGDGIEMLASEVKTQEFLVCESQTKQVLQKALRALPGRSAVAIEMVYGLNGFQEHTYEKAGEALGVSRERVRQMEQKGLRYLRHPSLSGKIKECAYV